MKNIITLNMKWLLAAFFLLFVNTFCIAQKYEVSSPDGSIKVTFSTDGPTFAVSYKNRPLLLPSRIGLILQSANPTFKVQKSSRRSNNSIIISPVPEKRKNIPDHYNELTLKFASPVSLVVRAYDDGVAYRWLTHFRDTLTIEYEKADFVFEGNPTIFYPQVVPREGVDIFHTSFEEPYQVKPLNSMHADSLAFTPVLVAPANGPKVVITESDLEEYPGMFICREDSNTLSGRFANYPIKDSITAGEFPAEVVIDRAGFIAKTKGARSFPWRVLIIAGNDKELPANDLVYRLASPSRVAETSWINPGQGTDEWIIGVNLFNVPFKSGVNTETYKYYIDFAKRFGFERIMLDAGWSDYKDLFKINPNINMDEIAAHARRQGIKLSMWTLAVTLEKQLEPALAQFTKWGVDFIMTDFMDRDDQKMMQFYFKIAEATARHKIMIMYHGAFKGAGFSRTWPHAITREGVLGSEYNIWSEKATPEHDLLLPFIRMTAGPMDYEPGILDNATQKTFRPIGDKVMSLGTRCHQAAMFVVYESPITIFSGNPSQGMMEPRFMELLGSIPTVWDTTIVLDGKIGDYIITARKKDNDWFIGAMSDWTPRELNIDLSFLGNGNYTAEICEDGINADRYPSDYTIRSETMDNKKQVRIKMGPGGGFLMRLKKQ
jgi:alpha-glucosidase